MGAWGEGLQANDTALDFINEKELATVANSGKLPEYVRHVQEMSGDEWEWAVLGIGEWLLETRFSLESIKPTLERAIDNELSRVDDWQNPQSRKRVLELFRDRLNGRPVPQEEIDASNEGLLARMLREGEEDEE